MRYRVSWDTFVYQDFTSIRQAIGHLMLMLFQGYGVSIRVVR